MENLQPPLRVAVLLLSVVLCASGFAAPTAKPALLKLAREKFAPRALTQAEEKLFVATEKGDMASMLVGNTDADDPAGAGAWPDNRTLYASSLAWLVTDPAALALVTHRGIQISGMRIVGYLNLSDVKMTFPFVAQNCSFEGDIYLADGQLRSLALICCFLQALDASRAHFAGVVLLLNGCRAAGPVSFSEATIEGSLNCENAHFRKGLAAELAKIGSEVFLHNGFTSEGGVNFRGATIGGNLRCEQSHFTNPAGPALSAESAKIDGGLLFSGSTAEGGLSFVAATIGRSVDLDGSRISNRGSWAFNAEGGKIGGDLLARNGFEAMGAVNLLGATVGGNLEFDGAWISNPKRRALLAERVNIGGNVFFRPDDSLKPFRAEGEVNLLGAQIGGSLYCIGAQLTNPEKNALMADGCKITGNAFLVDRFTPDGVVDLVDRFTADGTVDFQGAIIQDTFFWVNVNVLPTTILKLQSAKFGALQGQKETWPRPGNLFLDGLVYNRILDQTSTIGEDRTKWLALQPTDQFYPQPYEQLASVLRTMGRERDARDVMVGKNDQHQKFTHTYLEWWWYNVVGRLIGYGYKPSHPFAISIGLIILGAFLFWRGYSRGIIEPTRESAYEKQDATAETSATSPRPIAESYPRFSAVVYSLESFTPLLKLDQSSNWAPNANRGTPLHLGRLRFGTTGSWLRLYLWVHIILGWVLTSLWVGSITGLVKT
jgi:hypothetical protein